MTQSIHPAIAGGAQRTATLHTLGAVHLPSADLKRALVFSLGDGLLSSGMVALTETFALAAAVVLDASPITIALLGCLPLFLGSIGQLLLPRFVRPSSGRKPWVLWGVRLQSAGLLVSSMAGYAPTKWRSTVFAGAFVLASVSGNAANGLWMSWMGDLVPEGVRARHFAWRNRLFAWVYLACALGGGFLTGSHTTRSVSWNCFLAIFMAASILRYASSECLARQHEPPMPVHASLGRTSLPRSFLRFCITTAMVQGAAAMSGPFFCVFYLRDLQFDYKTFAVGSSCAVLGTIAALPWWARVVERAGSVRAFRLSVLLVAIVPLPYLFVTHPYAIWTFNFYSGVAWSGYNLVSMNHLLQAAKEGDRARAIAVNSALTGVVVVIMTLLGGLLSTRLPVFFRYRLQSLFLLSLMIRLFIWLAMMVGDVTDDERSAAGTSSERYDSVPGYRVGLGPLRNIFRAFRSQ